MTENGYSITNEYLSIFNDKIDPDYKYEDIYEMENGRIKWNDNGTMQLKTEGENLPSYKGVLTGTVNGTYVFKNPNDGRWITLDEKVYNGNASVSMITKDQIGADRMDISGGDYYYVMGATTGTSVETVFIVDIL